ncbi:class I SAM-dependent DNA methyltransferase [Chromobacterium sphagni]|nr:class I SAM-dependent methyltransferase [Chromobacterium sphagni]
MQSDGEMKTYYAERAEYYDAVYDMPERALDLAWLRRYLPQRLAGRKVLEVACGTGYWTQYLAPQAQRYLAIDAVAEPLALARQRQGVDKVEFRQADAYALPAEAAGFDAAFAGLWFSHVPKQRRDDFLAGLHGCLQTGAEVVFIDNSEMQCREHSVVEYDEAGNGYQMRPLRDGSRHRVLKNFPSETELRILLGRHGVSDMVFLRREHFWLLQYRLPDRH